jgi:hypothetical protein
MKKFLILLFPVLTAAFWAITWNIGNNNPVSSSHALSFLIHSSGVWFLPVLIAAIVLVILTTAGTIGSWFAVMYQKYIWIAAFALIFTVAAAFAYTRNAAAHDVNISARYNQYKVEKGWDK